MKRVPLGKTDLDIAPIVFGGNVFGWTVDEKKSFALLDHFTDLGFNMIDTADQYAHWVPGNVGGESETIIGKWLRQSSRRNQVLIATKVGGATAHQPLPNVSRNYIVQTVEGSLKRLGVETIDLYQTHFDDEKIPVEETLRAHEDLIHSGKVRWIGASNLSPQRLVESMNMSAAKGWHRYETLQPEYNLYNREKYERSYEPIAQTYGLGVLTYYSLASGFLSGKYVRQEDFKGARSGAVAKMFNQRGIKILAALGETAIHLNVSQAAVALAWLLHRSSVSAPIVSATSLAQMKSMEEAISLRLDAFNFQRLNEASAY